MRENDQLDILMMKFADDIILGDSPSDLRNKFKCLADYCNNLQFDKYWKKLVVLFHKDKLNSGLSFNYLGKKIKLVINTSIWEPTLTWMDILEFSVKIF